LQIGEDFLAWHRFQLAFLRNDQRAMQRIATEHELYGLLGFSEAYSGRMANARALWQRHAKSKRQHDRFAGEGTFAEVGLAEALLGDVERAKTGIRVELNSTLDPSTVGQAGLALALAGDFSAERVGVDLGEKWPLDWSAQRYWLPLIRATVALDHKDANGALASLATVSPYELSVLGRPFPRFLRGQAYLIAQNGSAAAVEFQNILEYRGSILGVEHLLSVLAHIGLARAYVLQGDTDKARTAYENFFTLWKDADPDIPILKQAKAEYAKLR
jgi:eukaryotic-like serine/threonine-protein kinase